MSLVTEELKVHNAFKGIDIVDAPTNVNVAVSFGLVENVLVLLNSVGCPTFIQLTCGIYCTRESRSSTMTVEPILQEGVVWEEGKMKASASTASQ
jgi:hypothetical protein